MIRLLVVGAAVIFVIVGAFKLLGDAIAMFGHITGLLSPWWQWAAQYGCIILGGVVAYMLWRRVVAVVWGD